VDEKGLAPRARYILYRVRPDGTEEVVSKHPEVCSLGSPRMHPGRPRQERGAGLLPPR
jgi:hypothetical protein